MSFFTNVTRTKITGLIAGWNTVNIASFVSILPGAKSVWLKFDTVGTLGTTHGARKVGSADTFFNASYARLKNDKLIEMVGGQVELYVGAPANGEWYIESFDSHFNFIDTPIQKGGSAGAGTYTLNYSGAGELPADAANGTALFELSRGVRIGAYGNVPALGYTPIPRAMVMIPLDSLRRCQYISAGGTTLDSDLRLIGWAPEGAVIHATTFTSMTVASAGSFLPLTASSTEVVKSMWRVYAGTDNYFYGLRASDSTNSDVDTNLFHRYVYSRQAPDGITNVNVSNIAIQFFYFGGIVGTLAEAQITDVDQLVAGEPSTITIDNTDFDGQTLSISDGAVTKTIAVTLESPGVYSCTIPQWLDGVVALKYGMVNVALSDGIEATPSLNMELLPQAGYSTQNIDSVNPLGVGASLSPAIKIGNQVLFKNSEIFVYKDYLIANVNGFYGTATIADRDATDFIARFMPLNIISQAADTAPDGDDFGSVNNVEKNTYVYAQNTITVLDVDPDTDIPAVALDGIEYRVNAGAGFGAWTTANTNVRLNYEIDARMLSANLFSTPKTGKLVVGGVEMPLTATTRAINSIPDAVILSWPTDGVYICNPFTINGVDVGANVSVVVGTIVNCTAEYSINDGTYTAANGVAYLDDEIKVKLTVSDPEAVTPNATLLIGGVPVVLYAPVNSHAVVIKNNNFTAKFM